MLISTRPSDPTSTPCGAEGSNTVWVTLSRFEVDLVSVAVPPHVTYS